MLATINKLTVLPASVILKLHSTVNYPGSILNKKKKLAATPIADVIELFLLRSSSSYQTYSEAKDSYLVRG